MAPPPRLRDDDDELVAALSALAEAVTIQDPSGRVIYANQAAADLLGFESPEAVAAADPRELVRDWTVLDEHGEPFDMTQLPGRRVLAGEDPPPVLLRSLNHRTGVESWRVTKATGVRDEAGRVRLAVNVIDDVTDVKRAELGHRLLAQASEALASSLDYRRTLHEVAHMAVPELADWCGVSIPNAKGMIESVAVAHVDPERVRLVRELQSRYPQSVEDEGGAAEVLRSGEPQLMTEITDEMLRLRARDEDHYDLIKRVGLRSVMIVPMKAAGRTIGTLSIATDEGGRVLGAADLELAEELGRRAGTAVENARLYEERSQIAHTLQQSLLPPALPQIPGWELASIYRPAGEANEVGGDFYDVFALDDGWMIVVGDVVGKGARAAALTSMARYTLRSVATLTGSSAKALEQLNRLLREHGELGLCSAVCVALRGGGADARTTITSGGHPTAYLIREGRPRPVGERGLLPGALDTAVWPESEVELRPDDRLVLYTDGVLDTVGDDGRFGEERLIELLHDASGSAGELARRIVDRLDSFATGPQRDDTAIVVLRRLARPPADPRGAPAPRAIEAGT